MGWAGVAWQALPPPLTTIILTVIKRGLEGCMAGQARLPGAVRSVWAGWARAGSVWLHKVGCGGGTNKGLEWYGGHKGRQGQVTNVLHGVGSNGGRHGQWPGLHNKVGQPGLSCLFQSTVPWHNNNKCFHNQINVGKGVCKNGGHKAHTSLFHGNNNNQAGRGE